MTIQSRKWRRRLGTSGSVKLRKVMAAVMFLECFYGLSRADLHMIQMKPLLHQEHIYRIEWVVPVSGAAEKSGNIYGIRFDRDQWEVNFYRTDHVVITE